MDPWCTELLEMYPVPVAMSSPIHYVSKSVLALSLSMVWNSFVQLVPSLMRMLSVPPGWSLRILVQS
jgi:hypothetical protein